MSKKLFPLLLITTLTSCSVNRAPIENRIFCFDTTVISQLYEGDQSNLDDIRDILLYYDRVSDNYNTREGITIRNISTSPIKVEQELYDLLKTSVDVSNLGATYFNPLCGSLAKKWKEALNKNELLSADVINAELEKINNSSLIFDDDYIISKKGEAEIDLGGIVKGYSLDKIKEYLSNKHIEKYLINAGFSSILLGKKDTSDGYFTVKISDLDNAYIKLQNCFITTSSKSVQGVKIGDITYSHIISPLDGSAININDAVIVVSSLGYIGDALSTSMMMNTVDEIKEIEKKQNVKTVVVRNRQVIYSSEGLELYHG